MMINLEAKLTDFTVLKGRQLELCAGLIPLRAVSLLIQDGRHQCVTTGRIPARTDRHTDCNISCRRNGTERRFKSQAAICNRLRGDLDESIKQDSC